MTHFRLLKKTPGAPLDVDFALPAGTTAPFGAADAGKSLLLEMAAGLVRADACCILFEDAILFDAVSRVDVPARRRNFGYLPPGDLLFPHLTLRENLRFAAQRFPRLDRHRRVTDWLERFDLTAASALFSRQLAPEQRLHGALARLLIAEPRLLLLDHPGLTESLLLRIRSLTEAPILFAARDLDLCCAAASHLLALASGRIAHLGAALYRWTARPASRWRASPALPISSKASSRRSIRAAT